VLVGFDTNDDAGVYRVDDDLALVQTVDFLTPIVDDPYVYGQIAAANALSDVYAMGGHPVSALSIVCFPNGGSPSVLEQILRGGLAKMDEAGCRVIGGHSVRDDEVKFGYAVTGTIRPDFIWRNVGACPGDTLLLTKPIGTGVIATAFKAGRAENPWVGAAIASMTELNRATARCLVDLQNRDPGFRKGLHAVTDVTGFGLLGHAHEMALGDPPKNVPSVSFLIYLSGIELMLGALEASADHMLSGGLRNNAAFFGDAVSFDQSVPDALRALLFDPQTSGGLLIAISSDLAERAIDALRALSVRASRIGSVVADAIPRIKVA
jgi:selenide,water dikinase